MERAREGREAVPDIVLERYHLAELPPPAMRRVAAAVEASEELRVRLAALDVSDSDTRAASTPLVIARAVQARRSGPSTQGAGRWLGPAGAVVAATLLVTVGAAVLRPDRGPLDAGSGDHDERIKGLEATLVVFKQTDGGGAQLGEDAVVRAGDLLRIGYRVARPGYGVIVSVDGRGVLTQHLPAYGARAVALQPGQTALLDEAFEIDDAPQLERFYLISSEEPFDVGPVVQAVQAMAASPERAVAPPTLADSLTFTTFTLRKDPRP